MGAATAIWAKQVGVAPIGVVHCRRADDVQVAIRAARELDVPLSVRGGGHDWAGRALCNGIVIDLGGMRDVFVAPDRRTALVSGGALASDVASGHRSARASRSSPARSDPSAWRASRSAVATDR